MYTQSSSWGCLLVSTLALVPLASAVPCSSCSSALPTSSNSTILPYLNPQLCIQDRLDDLISRMTLEEKAGQLFIKQIPAGINGTIDNTTFVLDQGRNFTTAPLISEKLLSHFNVNNALPAKQMAEWYNKIQQLALNTRLQIPVTIASDPRHAFADTVGSSIASGQFSKFPESLGIAALRSPELAEQYATIIREEYLAVGIRSALQPQIDVVTEPRMARSGQTFGEDANLTASMVVALIKGFQGTELGHTSVTTVTKHFPGAGPARNGNDSHFATGKDNTYFGDFLDYHLIPFKAAIAAGGRQIMPSYARPIGTKYPEVAFGFNKPVITGLLRDELGFEGIVVSDWGLITDQAIIGVIEPARAWGVENTTELERAKMVLDAGVDQFGGEIRTELIVQLVNEGQIPESRLDVSVRKLLEEKFMLGLFDNRFVDAEAADRVVGNPYFARIGNETQRRAYTLLTNQQDILPLRPIDGNKFYAQGFNSSYLSARNLTVVDSPEEADFCFLRTATRWEARGSPFRQRYHEGRLDFNATERAAHSALFNSCPTIVDILLDRPAVIPEIAEEAAALFGHYGASVDAFLDVVFNKDGWKPEGRLPFEMPRSMEAVEAQVADVPFDTADPLFRFGHGLNYTRTALCG
ncbi:beta-glucosidase C [Aureobasidium subglaciale]|nr:beta-glucosidase C [Aureobasidium subglaciale]